MEYAAHEEKLPRLEKSIVRDLKVAIIAEKAVAEAMELLEASDDPQLLALAGRLVQLERMILKESDSPLWEKNEVHNCADCSGVMGEVNYYCDFNKEPLVRGDLWTTVPKSCPLRERSFVLETVLKEK